MKKNKTYFAAAAFLVVTSFGIRAQNNTTAGGGDATGSGGSASYSIGQVDYIVQTGAGGTANQGVQQPYEILTLGGLSETSIQLEAVVFPNPTTSGIMLSIKETDLSQLSYTVYSVEGKLLDKKNITNQQTQIDLKNFA
ncbi:MAG: T9SS type A sorting domain-containing protein, partial [Bacteroidia bacterium]|nr:T9SS type A sorting domain-containing protein [Bacteroidia bacterium]